MGTAWYPPQRQSSVASTPTRSLSRRPGDGSYSEPISADDDDDEYNCKFSPQHLSTPERAGSVFAPRVSPVIKQERHRQTSRPSTPISSYSSRRSQNSQGSRQGSRPSQISQNPLSPPFDYNEINHGAAFERPTARTSRSESQGLFVSQAGTPTEQDGFIDGASRGNSSPPSSQLPKLGEVAVVLTDEQEHIVSQICLGNRNIFYTGSAGSGKSTVLMAARARLRSIGKRIAVVAPTGRAALDIDGTTIWSFAGWQPDSMKKTLKELEKLVKGRFTLQRMRELDVLIIDEISMVENHFFERLNCIMKAARGDDRAFGGVQLIATGDFCQLPPVEPFQHCYKCGRELLPELAATEYICDVHGTFYDIDKWAFRANAWEEADFLCFYLEIVHRQDDEVFQSILQKIRFGKILTNEELRLLLDHPCDVHGATRIFSTREEVRRVNDAKFNKIQARTVAYRCQDFWKWNRQHRRLEHKGQRYPDGTLVALKDHQYETIVDLKVGMRVVLMVNIDINKGLVNGSQGEIVGFAKHSEQRLPKPRSQVESSLRLGDDKEERIATDGVQSLGGTHVLLQYTQVKAFIASGNNPDKLWPVVKFDKIAKEVTVYANCRVRALGDDEPHSLIARTQIPLAPAWAMTIHKSQGMTLDKVIVDASRTFEQGQFYVATSRARNLEGFKLEGVNESWTGSGCNQQVMEFLREKFDIE